MQASFFYAIVLAFSHSEKDHNITNPTFRFILMYFIFRVKSFIKFCECFFFYILTFCKKYLGN